MPCGRQRGNAEATAGILGPHDCPRLRPRFLQLADVAETLNISAAQVYALVRSGELPAIKIGGRGSGGWRPPSWRATSRGCTTRPATSCTTHRFGKAEDEPADDDAPAGAVDRARGTRSTRCARMARATNGTVRTPVTSPRRRGSPAVLGHLDEVGTDPVHGPAHDAAVGEPTTCTGNRSRAIPRSAEPSPSRANT